MMSGEFRGYICWAPDRVNETIVVDAVNSSPAVFLATHRPAQVLRRDFAATSGGALIDEEQLLKEFLAPNPGLLFMPIIGEPGTGKSHLVRWLYLRMPPSGEHRVVYIPKYGTNLRTVIELILSDMQGPVVEELRAELRKAADSLDEAGAPRRLLYELAASIEDQAGEAHLQDAGEDDEYRQWLQIELPKLLLDNVFRTKLLEKDGVIDRLVREALKGKQEDDKEQPFAFEIKDLPLSVAEVTRANKDVQLVFEQLIGSDRLKQVAVDLLNDNLGPAIRKLFGMGGSRLSEVMLAVRRALLDEGVELVLLIEDFTILQGIQRELLDAITEAPMREGAFVMCPIRAAMAVTTGYFATLAQTFTTRAGFAGHVYSLDIPLAGGGRGVSTDDVADFVGGYLNAARLGQARLEHALSEAGSERATQRRWVPSACDECDHQDICHESFGTSGDGFGLYPFNRAALERAVQAKSRGHFDPRRILGTVVRYTLDQHRHDIEHGDFPSPSFGQQFAARGLAPFDPELAEDLRYQDPTDSERRVVLLTFWGGRPDKIENLAPGIHEAFSIEPLENVELQRPRPRPDDEKGTASTEARGEEELPAPLRRRVRDIDQWSSGTSQLDQALAGDLRRFIHAAIVARIDWNDELLHPSDDVIGPRSGKYFRQASIDIKNALGGGPRPSTAAVIELPATAESATLLRSVLFYQQFGHWGFERGDERLRRFAQRLDEWSQVVVAAVRGGGATGDEGWDPTRSAIELLAFGARVLDLPGSHSQQNADLLDALLSDPPQSPPARRGTAWDKLADACGSDNRRKVRDALLARVGARQGTGRPQAVDVTSILPAISAFKRSWRPSPPADDAPTEFRRLYGDISTRLDAALEEERQRLQQWYEWVTSLVEPENTTTELIEQVGEAASAAIEAGIFEPARLRQEFEESTRTFRRARFSVIKEIGDLLSGATDATPGKALSDLAADRTKAMGDIERYLRQASQILEASAARGDQQAQLLTAGGASGEALLALERALDHLCGLLEGSDS